MPKAARADEEAIARFVEEAAQAYAEMGLPKIAGRILAHLFVCDPPRATQQELVTALGASKASVSTMLRLLMQSGNVRRTSLPGDRREYFEVPLGAATESLSSMVRRLTRVRDIAERGLEVLKGTKAERSVRLREMHAFTDFLAGEIEGSVERWKKEQKKRARKDS